MMALTTKARYAARIMVYLAEHDGDGPATKNDIGRHEDISPDYVEQIMMRLKNAGLIRSFRGRNGGFALTRPADEITLATILRAVAGPISPAPCMEEHCARETSCPTRPVWLRAAAALEDILKEATVASMAKDARTRTTAVASYDI